MKSPVHPCSQSVRLLFQQRFRIILRAESGSFSGLYGIMFCYSSIWELGKLLAHEGPGILFVLECKGPGGLHAPTLECPDVLFVLDCDGREVLLAAAWEGCVLLVHEWKGPGVVFDSWTRTSVNADGSRVANDEMDRSASSSELTLSIIS